jgi:Family of unknown function (DUF5565)
VTSEPNPECGWVFAGEGVPTRKYDGTCVMYDGDSWWARREIKPGKQPPPGFVEVAHDEATGKTVGWEPAGRSSFEKYLTEAIGDREWSSGTFELIGPKVNGNPEQSAGHSLVRHGADDLGDVPRDFTGLSAWLHAHPWEGIVWHHPDGRMAKLKRRDIRP